MADENQEGQSPTEGGGGGLVKKLLIGVGALVLLAIGIAVGPMILGDKTDPEASGEASAGEAAQQSSSDPAIYTSLHPPIVVNFKDSLGDPHFMQITMEVMARNQSVINAVREHTPVIRNNLILLYGNANYEAITTRQGKEAMLADGLQVVQEVMTEQIGEPGVEAVYFTSLIIQ